MAPDTPAPANDAHPAEASDALIGHHPPERRLWIERVRRLNLAMVLGLIVLGLAWELWLAPLKGGTGALAIKVLPLSLAIAGLLKHRLYTTRWLSMLVLLYFTEGVVRSTTEHGLSQGLACAELTMSVLLFFGCAAYVKLRLKVLPPKVKGQKSADKPDAVSHTA